MASTSPDNIRTPDPGAPFNLVPDLATLANDVQDALNTRGNLYRGSVSERTAFSASALPGMLWQDTDSIGMLWKRTASSWVPAVWRWSGTTTQMNAFSSDAPNGFGWFSTTDNSNYTRIGGSWVMLPALRFASGEVSIPGGSGSITSAEVTFPTGRFTGIPAIALTAITGAPGTFVEATYSGASSTGFTAYCLRESSTTTQVSWMAFQAA